MARRKNVKRIDPRYFLHETVNRNDDGSRMEESNQCVSCLLEAGRCTCDHTGCHSNPKGRQDCDTGLRIKGLEEDLDEVLEEEEIEEGFKDFVQGTKDTFRDITKGRKLGKTRQIRQDKEAALDYEAGRADREKEAERDRREKRGDEMSMVQRLAQAQRLADRDGGSSSGSDDAIYNVFGGSKARMAQDRYDKRQRDKASRRRQKVKDELEADAFSKKQRELAADRPKSNTAYVGSGGVGSSKRYNEE